MSKTTFIATGDVFITRRLPKEGYEGFDALRDVIASILRQFAQRSENRNMNIYADCNRMD